MWKPGGNLSCAVGNLSSAAGSGGGAMGASLAAASLPSGRPISAEPGGNAAAGAAAGGADGAGDCWAESGAAVKRPAIVPASSMLRRAVKYGYIEDLPDTEALICRRERARPERASLGQVSLIDPRVAIGESAKPGDQ